MFTNLDAQYLDSLGETFITDGDIETGLRLRQIARNLESMDNKLATVTQGGEFAAGVLEAHRRLISKSNVPDLIVEPSLQDALKSFKGSVKKIPQGVSGLAPGESGTKFKPKTGPGAGQKKLNITINLSSLVNKK